jgi:hypothetical protein
LCSLLLGGATWLAESLAHDHPSTRWLLPAMPIVTLFFFAGMSSIWRATEAAAARKLAAKHAPEERCLLAGRMPAGRVVIATDQRVFAVTTPRLWKRSRPLWSLPYSRISWFDRADKKNPRRVTLHAGVDTQRVELRVLGDESQSYDYQKYHEEALLVILGRRAASSRPKKGSQREPGSEQG